MGMKNKIVYALVAVAFASGLFTTAYAGPIINTITLAGNTHTLGNSDIDGELKIGGDLSIGIDNPDDDDAIFFDDGTKFLQWEDAPFNEFFFNAPLGVGGGLLIDDSMQLGGHFEITSTFLDTDYNRMGTTTSNHGLNDNQDLFIGKSLEVDGPSWFDGQMQITTGSATPLGIDRSGDGPLIVFTRDGGFVGGIDVAGGTVTYGAFTGSHYAWTDEYLSVGMLVSMIGNNQYLGDASQSEIIYGITKSSQKNDPAILGAYLATKISPLVSETDNIHLVMAEGNGDVWIADMGQDIQPGDYLISSAVVGHAMKDDRSEELSHNYWTSRRTNRLVRSIRYNRWCKTQENIDSV